MFAVLADMRMELRQDVMEVSTNIQRDMTILREEFVAASSARSESLPLPSQPGPVEHSQHIRARNNNGRIPLQAAGGAPDDSDHDDSEEDEDVNPNQVDQPDPNIRTLPSAISVQNPTVHATPGAGGGGGGDDSSDNSYGNDDSHGSEGTDENIPSPIAPPLHCPEAFFRDLQDRRNPDPLIRLRIPSVLTQM